MFGPGFQVLPGVTGHGDRASEKNEMQGTGLFEQALGLERPWYVERTGFDAGQRRLDLYLNFEMGGTFACGGCGGEGCKAYDTTPKQCGGT